MPSILTEQGDLHYEVIGSGPPVILIHGWTQAWNTWRSTLETFQNRYRMYAPDLWGFGESEKQRDSFQVSDYVELIPEFMEKLGMLKVPIMGHSMGGTTALGVALKYPERVKKVAVVGSPIDGRSLSLFLKMAGQPIIAKLMLMGEGAPILRAFIRGWSPFVSRPQPNLFYNMTIANSQGFTLDSFFSSIDSLHHTDLRDQLNKLKIPAMGIYGARDVIVNPNQVKLFDKLIPHGKTVLLRKAGHFPMWDTPTEFNEAFQQFMDM